MNEGNEKKDTTLPEDVGPTATTQSPQFPDNSVGNFFKSLVVGENTLKNLIEHPGQRARLFDKSGGSLGEEAKSHIKNARVQLESLKPPFTETSVKNAYGLFNKLNQDLDKGGLNILMTEINKNLMTVSENELEKLLPLPQVRGPELATIEQLRDKVSEGIKSDILGAYRFKTMSASEYYDEKVIGERQKDFLQLINKTSKTSGSPEACLTDLRDKISTELVTNARSIISTTSPSELNDALLSSILTQKHYEYLGPETTLAEIQKAFKEENKEGQFEEFKKLYETARRSEDEAKEILTTPDINPNVALDKIQKNPNFKTLGAENATQIVMNQVLKMPTKVTKNTDEQKDIVVDNILRNQLLEELPKQPLIEFLDKKFNELKKSTAGNIENEAKQLIKSISDNKHYVKLNGVGNTNAAKILFEKINGMENSEHKTALTSAMYSVAEDKIKRRIQDNKSPEETLKTIREDNLCAVLNQDEINKRIATQILNLPKTQKERVQPLLDKLNEHTGENFIIPKSGFDAFKEKAGNWFKKVRSAIVSSIKDIGSAIGSAINNLKSKNTAQTTPTNTSSEDMKQPISDQNPIVDWNKASFTPQQARLYIKGNGKIRSNDEVIKMLHQSAYQQLIDNPTGKSEAATQRLEQILSDFNAVFDKVQKDCVGNPAEFSRYTREILDTTLVLERRKNQVDPSIKVESDDQKNTQNANLSTKPLHTPPNKPLPPLPTKQSTPNDEGKNTNRPF